MLWRLAVVVAMAVGGSTMTVARRLFQKAWKFKPPVWPGSLLRRNYLIASKVWHLNPKSHLNKNGHQSFQSFPSIFNANTPNFPKLLKWVKSTIISFYKLCFNLSTMHNYIVNPSMISAFISARNIIPNFFKQKQTFLIYSLHTQVQFEMQLYLDFKGWEDFDKLCKVFRMYPKYI